MRVVDMAHKGKKGIPNIFYWLLSSSSKYHSNNARNEYRCAVLVYTKPVSDSVFCMLWLATQTQDSITYSPFSILRISSATFLLISQKKIIVWCWLSTGLDNGLIIVRQCYAPQCWWRVVDIYLAASLLGKYPPLFTSSSVNNCVNIHMNFVICMFLARAHVVTLVSHT